jgi:hypothetical protein
MLCYVYLVDVTQERFNEQFKSSRWFTRGWTLQELIAPETVIFFDRSWQMLGRRHELAQQISSITGINISVLRPYRQRLRN